MPLTKITPTYKADVIRTDKVPRFNFSLSDLNIIFVKTTDVPGGVCGYFCRPQCNIWKDWNTDWNNGGWTKRVYQITKTCEKLSTILGFSFSQGFDFANRY